jgi:SAM-dependent methyltransferase
LAFTRDQILELYRSEATKHGDAGTSTIQDIRTRQLELQALSSYMADGISVLEVGCGNGFTAQVLAQQFDLRLDAFDFSPEMIAIAEQRRIDGARGRVRFFQQDVLTYRGEAQYDLCFTERCLQNLTSWEDQQRGLANVVSAIRPGGEFVMLEGFKKGLATLNAARAEIGLPAIPEPWHNLFFEEEAVKQHLASLGCAYLDENPFLSGYYFGSRVLYPALLPEGKTATSSSILNDYFAHLPPHGDFCPMKILRFRRS